MEDDATKFQVKPENMNQYAEKITELLDVDITLDVPQFKLSDFDNNQINIEAKYLFTLTWLISLD